MPNIDNNINDKDKIDTNTKDCTINKDNEKSESFKEEVKGIWNGQDLDEEEKTPRNILVSRIQLISHALIILYFVKDIWTFFTGDFSLNSLINFVVLAIRMEICAVIVSFILKTIIFAYFKVIGITKYNRPEGERISKKRIALYIIIVLFIVGYLNIPQDFEADLSGVYYTENGNEQYLCVHILFKNTSSKPIKFNDSMAIELYQNKVQLNHVREISSGNKFYDLPFKNGSVEIGKNETIDIFLLYEARNTTDPIEISAEQISDILGTDTQVVTIGWNEVEVIQ